MTSALGHAIISIVVSSTVFLSLLLVGDFAHQWQLSSYWDDKFNFLDFPHLNTLSPYSYVHLVDILKHKGINVYEPVGNLMKAAIIDIVGLNSSKLRAFSFLLHTINSILLFFWLNKLTRIFHSYSQSQTVASIVALVFLVHPLNVEVNAWLSAQNYTISLLFSLLSSIYFEEFIEKYSMRVGFYSVAFSSIACYCKAPAIVIPLIHIVRLCFHLVMNKRVLNKGQSQGNIQLAIYVIVHGISFAVILTHILSANSSSQTAIGSFHSMLPRFFRAIVIIASFSRRIILPYDLRAHYNVPEEECYKNAVSIVSSGMLQNIWKTDVFFQDDSLCSFPHYTAVILTDFGVIMFCGFIALACMMNKYKLLAFGAISYIICWAPGCGIISHGWEQMGADRYNYFPIAFGVCPLLCSVLQPLVSDEYVLLSCDGQNHGNNNETETTETETAAAAKAEAEIKVKILNSRDTTDKTIIKKQIISWICVMFGLVMWIVCLIPISRYQLLAWRSDKYMLEHCISVDPRDWECQYYLGDYYGYHEKNETAGIIHSEKALASLPRSISLKNRMFRAKVLLFLRRTKDSCQVIYDACDDIRTAAECLIESTFCSNINRQVESNTRARTQDLKRTLLDLISLEVSFILNRKDIQYYPSVVNNYVLCHLAENGISIDNINDADDLLQSSLILTSILSTLPNDVIVPLEDHLRTIRALKSGSTQNYGASFLW